MQSPASPTSLPPALPPRPPQLPPYPQRPPGSTLVELPDGRVLRGLEEGGVTSWRGVPFAQPPIGRLRFLPPQPLLRPARGSVWDATSSRPNCEQPEVAPPEPDWPGLNGSRAEDCLYLNVWRPRGMARRQRAAG